MEAGDSMESPESMQAFLNWLGGDTASGARRYEEIRQRLILLFRYRGCHIAEELADETIDRTARAVLKPDFQFEGDCLAYFRGVARNVYLEWMRKEQRTRTEPIPESGLEAPAESTAAEIDGDPQFCLDQCLNRFPAARKILLIRYYQSDKRAKIDGRQILAQEMGIGLNALRIQVFRLRNSLRKCINGCMARRETKGSS
jgi:DNA-directed RNA polymerase specialized sigma24 family protein